MVTQRVKGRDDNSKGFSHTQLKCHVITLFARAIYIAIPRITSFPCIVHCYRFCCRRILDLNRNTYLSLYVVTFHVVGDSSLPSHTQYMVIFCYFRPRRFSLSLEDYSLIILINWQDIYGLISSSPLRIAASINYVFCNASKN